jgi:hypothetical protein
VFEAATDGEDQLRYVAGEDAKAMWAQRQAVGSEELHRADDVRGALTTPRRGNLWPPPRKTEMSGLRPRLGPTATFSSASSVAGSVRFC